MSTGEVTSATTSSNASLTASSSPAAAAACDAANVEVQGKLVGLLRQVA